MTISFNGSSSKLELDGISAIVSAYPFTVVCWFKCTTLGTTQMIYEHGDSSANEAIRSYCSSGSTARSAVINGGTGAVKDANHSPSNATAAWLAYVCTGATQRTAWLNDNSGSIDDTASLTPTFANFDRMIIGAGGGGGIFFFGGEIAEVHFFNAAMSSGNFASIVGGAAPETIANWVDGWKLTTATDLTSIGGTRTLTATSVTTGGTTHPITRTGGASSLKQLMTLGVG
jgi:hypothetical protein